MYSDKKPKSINKYLLWGVIVLTMLLLIWLSFYLYFGAVEGGTEIKAGDAMEQIQE